MRAREGRAYLQQSSRTPLAEGLRSHSWSRLAAGSALVISRDLGRGSATVWRPESRVPFCSRCRAWCKHVTDVS